MLLRLMLIIFASLLATSNALVKCDFKYTEYDDTATNEITIEKSKHVPSEIIVSSPEIKGPFECDDGFEKVRPIESRFNDDYNEDDDPYSTVESSCKASRSTIRPSFLSNIKGEETQVLQSSNFIQEIHIEKCAYKKSHNLSSSYEECFQDRNLHITQKHICREVHVKVMLRVGDEASKHYEEFYYPSNCVCELVRLKNSP